jgi:L-malate glycosyltransferase
MASGVPVIASSAGGLPEVVEHGETGFLAPVGDIETMADAGIELLRDMGRWLRVSMAGRASAVERFGVDVVVPQYEVFYRRVLAGGEARGRQPVGMG